MDEEYFVAQMNEIAKNGDAEGAHSMADDVMVMALRCAGWDKLADAFLAARKEVGFWYA